MATSSTYTNEHIGMGVSIHTWILTGSGGPPNTGDMISCPGSLDKTIQVYGTFAGKTLSIYGSMNGTNWNILHDPQGNDMAYTGADTEHVLENVMYIRPSLVASEGAPSVTIVLLIKRLMEK